MLKLNGSQFCAIGILLALVSCEQPVRYDVILRNGTFYDGTGAAPRVADVAIQGERIAAIGDLSEAVGTEELDAAGLAVASNLTDDQVRQFLPGRIAAKLHAAILYPDGRFHKSLARTF